MKTTAKVITVCQLCVNYDFGVCYCSSILYLIIFVLSYIFCFSVFFPLRFSPRPTPEKRSEGLFHQITKTHGTVIGVSSGIVLILLIISILVQMKQPRKKVAHPLWLTFC